jgi:hypothetical protein
MTNSLEIIIKQGSCYGILCRNCYFFITHKSPSFCSLRNAQSSPLTKEQVIYSSIKALREIKLKRILK